MRTLHILLLTILLSYPLSGVYGQTNPCTAVDTPFSIVYRVDHRIVPRLQGFVQPGSLVTVTVSRTRIKPRTGMARYTLVSYTTMNPNYDTNRTVLYHVYQYQTLDVPPTGNYTLSVRVPNTFFELDFVGGCLIACPGPCHTNNFYEKQHRCFDRDNGGDHAPKHNECGGPGNYDTCKKVTICHIPPGNPENAHEITISKNAVAAHFRNHGDYYGPCKKDTTPPPVDSCLCDYDGNGLNDRIYGSTETSVDGSIKVYFSAAGDTANMTANYKMQVITVTYADFTTNTYDKINSTGFQVTATQPIVAVTVDGNYIENLAFTDPNFMCDCIPNPSPFPVTMTSFDAKVIDPNTVKLQWSTASETNNAYFQIEKSTDIMTWEDVPGCHVPGSGTTQQPHTYSCVDIRANAGGQNIVYYRNKQVDYDGAYEYSNTIHIRLENASYPTTVDKAYPNPMEDQIHIKYNSDDNGIFNIRVTSLDGKTLLTNEYVAKKGSQIIDLDLPENRLKSGFYILEVKSDDQVFRQKIYKQ